MRRYGSLPEMVGTYSAECREFMFYQYLPVKMVGDTVVAIEPRLLCFDGPIGAACCDFIGLRGLDAFVASYVYVTAKHMYQVPGCSFNRPGWHSDGFLTDDINYIWYDCAPTIFNSTPFYLTLDDDLSLVEMESQADPRNDVTYGPGTLLRLDQFCIHRAADVEAAAIRTFLKVSFSGDKYDLIGNSRNPLIQYDWSMRERALTRNVPQHLLTDINRSLSDRENHG